MVKYREILSRVDFIFMILLSLLLLMKSAVSQQNIQIKPIYKVFALLRVSSNDVDHSLLFEQIAAAVREIAKSDETDINTFRQITLAKTRNSYKINPHFPLQYIDSSGAKITVSINLIPDYTNDQNIKEVSIALGYGEEKIPEQQVSDKVAQINHLVENACSALATKCLIERISLPKAPGL